MNLVRYCFIISIILVVIGGMLSSFAGSKNDKKLGIISMILISISFILFIFATKYKNHLGKDLKVGVFKLELYNELDCK